MSRGNNDLRVQLLKAKATIVRQLEILRDPAAPSYFAWSLAGPDNREVIAKLGEELREIEDRLKDFDA